MPEKNEQKNVKVDWVAAVLVVLIVAVAVVGVNCYISEYEKSCEVVRLENAVREAQNENDRLNIEYQRRSSYLNVEEYVTEQLGMKKLNKVQYQYIDRSVADAVSVEGTEVAESGLVSDIVKAFSVILEYFR